MRRATSFLLGLAASLVLGSSPSVFADVIYSQPSNFPVANDVGVWSSQTDQFGNFSEAYDNFTLSSTENILSVNWQGGYFFPPVQGPIDGFQISFYADVGGQPGASPLSTNFVSGTANETFVGVEPGTGLGGNAIYNYSAPLDNPFTAQAGVQYWLSIIALFDTDDNEAFGLWGWHTGTGGDGISLQDFDDNGNGMFDLPAERFQNGDLAFALVVPEPVSIVAWGLLGGSCLAGAGLRRWRRRKVLKVTT